MEVEICGYPSSEMKHTLREGKQQQLDAPFVRFRGEVTVKERENSIISHTFATYTGMTGSPIFTQFDGRSFVIGIHCGTSSF